MMSDTEKVSMNLSIVDLGQIDLLIDQGYYSGRTDFLRTAIRGQLASHAEAVKEAVTRRAMVVGVLRYDRASLEAHNQAGRRLDVKVVGMLVLDDDVTPELARSVFASLEIRGAFRAPDGVKRALQERTR
jgi:Arc/MetJ-type ribon-helix-helix transcriptional regulator